MTTITLLLADDEPMILRGLKKLLPWEELGIRIVGEASDGQELRRMIREHDPQLVISDISMPEGSGIDIIKELNGRDGRAKIVFISAFQEFGYAKEAVQLGALDYLVKPISKSQLENVVRRAVQEIREEKEGQQNKETLHYYQAKDRAQTIGESLERLLDGDLRALPILKEAGGLSENGFYTVFVIGMDEAFEGTTWQEKERGLAKFAIGNIVRESLASSGGEFRGAIVQKEERFAVLLQHEETDSPASFIEELVSRVERYLKLHVACGVGRTTDRIHSVDRSYRSAVNALNRTYFTGYGRVLLDEEEEAENALSCREQIAGLQLRLGEALATQREEDIRPLAEELFRLVSRQVSAGKHAAVSALYHAILSIGREWERLGGEEARFQQANEQLLERLSSCPSYAEACTVAEDALRKRLGISSSEREIRSGDMAARIRAYIDEHYADSITLESMSADFYMNPYYFSSFFKKHMNQNFKNYVTEVRMRAALILLRKPEWMIYEIAEQVGYHNVRQFSDTFKKKYGQAPQDYRQSVQPPQG